MIKMTRMQHDLSERNIIALLLAALVVAAPLSLHLALWISLVFVLCCAWRTLATLRAWRLPGTVLRLALLILGLAGVLMEHGTVLGRDAGVALLMLMMSFKLLEMNTLRDAHVVIVLDYFLLLTHFLFSQSMFAAAYMVLGVVAVTAVLNKLNYETEPQRIGWYLRNAASVALQALPLMAIMFIMFPRFAGPIWTVPTDSSSGTTGLSQDMAPGRISNLAQSDAVAFRVSFDDAIPAPEYRYWRGPVLWYTDGERWSAARKESTRRLHQSAEVHYTGQDEPVTYNVTLEPHNQRSLFALDLPASRPKFAHMTSDYQLLTRKRVTQRLHYPMSSHIHYDTGRLSTVQRQRALQLPEGNPRTRALARQWRARYNDDQRIVEQALRFFRERPFVYTLQPPPLSGGAQSDQFLFDTRRGFCEHYAASFTWLMRAAGIPTRVVTGYQGGEYNDMGDYFIVRQRDAHAWAEVWLKGQGWVRVDPTAAVAPERIEMGIDTADQSSGEAIRFAGDDNKVLLKAWDFLNHSWDALNYNWHQWVLGYSSENQSRLLEGLGFDIKSWRDVVTGLILALIAAFAVIALLMLHNRDDKEDPIVRAYHSFCRKLARRGITRAADEGPADFAKRVTRQHPELAAQVGRITRLYIKLRYSNRPVKDDFQQLRQSVRAFRP